MNKTARSALAFVAALLSACAPAKKFCPAGYAVDFDRALQFAVAADLAYAPDSAVNKACAQDNCFIVAGTATGARAYVRVIDSAKTQWISFRGTQTFADIKSDAEYTQSEDSVLHMRLHRGFAAAARDLYPLIRPHLRKDYKTLITGHSLGGAVAVISALYLRSEGFTVECETFGQPKVTNAAGARLADSLDLTRFLNGEDLVTQVPPVSWIPGADNLGPYAHFGREVALLNPKGFECLQQHYNKRYDPTSWWAQAQEDALTDHSIALYEQKLKALIMPVAAIGKTP